MSIETTLKQAKAIHNAARTFIDANPVHVSVPIFKTSLATLGSVIDSIEKTVNENMANNLYNTGIPTIDNEGELNQQVTKAVSNVLGIFSPIASHINSISVLQVSKEGLQILQKYATEIAPNIAQVIKEAPEMLGDLMATATGAITPAAAAAAAGTSTGLFGLNIPAMLLKLTSIQGPLQAVINTLLYKLDLLKTNIPINIKIALLKTLIELETLEPPNLPRIDETRLKVNEPSESPNALYISIAKMLAQYLVQLIIRTAANPSNNSEAKGAAASVSGAASAGNAGAVAGGSASISGGGSVGNAGASTGGSGSITG
jgi:hypothetical protein